MTTTLALAAGGGRLVRRPSALLFLPAPDTVLLAAFRDADEDGELQALASATVAEGFAVGGFAAVSWRDRDARVMVFGDVAVETDQPSLPMVTGAGSRTWVEHSLRLDGTAVITVGDDEAIDDDTHLEAGTALAGGFRLRLDPTTEPRLAVDAATFEPDPADEPEPPSPAPAPAVDPTATAPTPRVMPTAPIVDPTDPEAALHAIQAAAMNDEGQPLVDGHPAGATPPAAAADEALPPPQEDPDVTLAPPDAEAVRAELHDGSSSLIEAKVCSRQHPNPPAVASCAVCGELLPPGGVALAHVPQPVLGALLLDDGLRVELDAELVLGRNPGRDGAPDDADHESVRVPGDKVSRRHLAVRRHGWDVTVTDLGSTNGSFVVPHPGGPVLALEPGRPQLVEPGATVYFGSRSFTVLGREPGATP